MLVCEHGGDVYRNRVSLDFSVNTHPLGLPGPVRDALTRNLDAVERYPDPYCEQLRRAIAHTEQVSERQILCGNGAADLIYRLCWALRPNKVLVCAPTFSEYERAARLSGAAVVVHSLLPQDNFALTERFLQDITPDIDLVFLCTPNNPTGRLISPSLLEAAASRHALLVVDECFLPFTDGVSAKRLPHTAVLKAFTKIYAMAGLRLGYLLCDEQIIRKVGDCGPPWSVSVPAQVAGLAALGCDGWLEQTLALIKTERDFLSNELRALGLTVWDSDANFLLLHSETPLYSPLLRRGVLIRNCENFAGLNECYSRVAVKTRGQNEQLLASIREVVKYG